MEEAGRKGGEREEKEGRAALIRSFARGKAIRCVETQLTLLKTLEERAEENALLDKNPL